MTGVKTKSAASRIRTVLMNQVIIDVRRVVGRENSSSQITSFLLMTYGSEVVRTARGHGEGEGE